MPTDFTLPDVGEGVAEGELVKWLVEEGDTVEEDQPIAEVETDKAVVDVPSPYDGTVAELHWDEGDIVPVGDVFITYNVEGEDAEADAGGAETEAESTTTEVEPADADTGGAEAGEAAADETTEETAAAVTETTGRTFAPPSVRRLARELGVDIDAVDGSGPSGRVTEGDVRRHAEGGETETEAAEVDESETAGAEDEVKQAVSKVSEEAESAGDATAPPQKAADRKKTLASTILPTRRQRGDDGGRRARTRPRHPHAQPVSTKTLMK